MLDKTFTDKPDKTDDQPNAHDQDPKIPGMYDRFFECLGLYIESKHI